MKHRSTPEKKLKMTVVRTTPDEHSFIKIKAAERGISVSRMLLEAIRSYLKDS